MHEHEPHQEEDHANLHPCFHPISREDQSCLFKWVFIGCLIFTVLVVGFVLVF